ncbi:acyl-CoA thioesterase [Myxococcota bacterium]|nr:acyl-CoA thioesterase [Myxococcota bacterium]
MSDYRVIYGDTDAMKVVYHANYFRFFEVGRNAWFRSRGHSYTEIEEAQCILPVVEVGARYKASARFDELLEIGARLDDMRKVSLRFEYRVTRKEDGLLLCTGFTRHGCVDKQDGSIRTFPDIALAVFSSEIREDNDTEGKKG